MSFVRFGGAAIGFIGRIGAFCPTWRDAATVVTPEKLAKAVADVELLQVRLNALSGVDFDPVNGALAQIQNNMAEVMTRAGGIAQGFEGAIKAASEIVSRATFESHGMALMKTFAKGIRNGAREAVAATKDVVGQIRDYLPHNPAKVGPLSDLDRVRFSETLAAAMRPLPAIRAAGKVAAGVRQVLNGSLSMGLSQPLSASVAASGSGGSMVSLNFSPVINIEGKGDRATIEGVMRDVMAELKKQLPRILERVADNKARKAY